MEQMELQTNGPLEGTGIGLEVTLAKLSLYSLSHSDSVSGTGNGIGPWKTGLYMRQPTSHPWVSHSSRGHWVP